MAVHVTNSCPVDVWVHGVGSEGTLQPDNAHLSPGAARDYDAPATWSAARIYAYLQAPDGAGNPQGQNDKVEMNFGTSNGVETINTDITYVDWVALPTRIQAIGSGSDCTTVGCEVPYSTILNGCPASLLSGHECVSAGMLLPQSDVQRRSDVPRARRQRRQLRRDQVGLRRRGRRDDRAGLLVLGRLLRQQPAVLRGAQPRRPQPRRARRRRRARSIRPRRTTRTRRGCTQRCPGIYAFPYDDYGASNQSSDHTCGGATQLNITFCPQG